MSVIPWQGITFADLPPDQVLDQAKGKLGIAIVIGTEGEDGDLYVASSAGDAHEALALMARATAWLCRQIDTED